MTMSMSLQNLTQPRTKLLPSRYARTSPYHCYQHCKSRDVCFILSECQSPIEWVFRPDKGPLGASKWPETRSLVTWKPPLLYVLTRRFTAPECWLLLILNHLNSSKSYMVDMLMRKGNLVTNIMSKASVTSLYLSKTTMGELSQCLNQMYLQLLAGHGWWLGSWC